MYVLVCSTTYRASDATLNTGLVTSPNFLQLTPGSSGSLITITSPSVVTTPVTFTTSVQASLDQSIYVAPSSVTVTYRKGLYLSQADYNAMVINGASATPRIIGSAGAIMLTMYEYITLYHRNCTGL